MALSFAMSFAANAADNCDRNCLTQIADGYFNAMALHSAASLRLSPEVRFTENGRSMKLGEGFWKTAGKVTYRSDIADPETGGIGIEAIVMEGAKPVLMLVRLKVAQGMISEAETIVCREGDDSHWGVENLVTPPALFTRPIRVAERDSRHQIMAAADAYFRAFETEGTSSYVRAPFASDVERYENGVHTTNVSRNGREPRTPGQQFDMGQYKNARIYDRRYPVVDVERGVVLSIIRFGRKTDASGNEIAMLRADGAAIPKPDNSPLVAEWFAVRNGTIREIRAVLIRHGNDAPTGWPAEPVGDCGRDCLKRITDRYFASLAANSLADLPLGKSIKYTENGRQMKMGEGFWKTAGRTTYRLDAYDPESGGAGVSAVVMEHGKPAMVTVRLRVVDKVIVEAETIIVRKDHAGVNFRPGWLTHPSAHFVRPLRPAEQNSRLELMAAADAYYRAFETAGTVDYVPAPFLPDTDRFENGVQMTNTSVGGKTRTTIAEEFESPNFLNGHAYERRYPVVDVERGIVLAIVGVDSQPRPDGIAKPRGETTETTRAALASDMFSINAGKIREVQRVLVPAQMHSSSGW
ncbi:MAG: hypothetical protein ABI859_06680 [Pseudomonadota bacterium]